MSVAENWRWVHESIARHTDRAVAVCAVTKGRSADDVRAVVAAGATVLGENRTEEVLEKYETGGLRAELRGVEVHMIGHLQSRKAREAVRLFDCIQSLDSVKLAREIDKRCAEIGRAAIDVLIEVNVSGEEQKYGARPEEAAALAREILALPRLRLKGLMTMAPLVDDESVIRTVFLDLKNLAVKLGQVYGSEHFAVLSMGMSQDYAIACDEGSTMVRIGTALFE